MTLMKMLTAQNKPTAKVIDGTLILSLPNAVSPVVWRMDLKQTEASALEIQDKDNKHLLVQKSAKGDIQIIAPFDTKSEATKTLMVASSAMEQGSNDNGKVKSGSVIGKIFKFLFCVLGLILLITLSIGFARMGPQYYPAVQPQPAQINTQASGSTDAGVPINADDFLKNRR